MPKETHTTVRSLRSDDKVWNPFGEAVGNRSRSAWLNDFMAWVGENPEVWTAAHDQLDDRLGTLLAQFLAWYQRMPGARMPTRPAPPPMPASTTEKEN